MEDLKKPIVFPEIDASGEPAGCGWPTLYADCQANRVQSWAKTARKYEKDPTSFYRAWYWLQGHPLFWYFGREHQHESTLCDNRGVDEGLEFRPAMVNKVTRKTEGPMKDRELEIWVEVFPTSLKPGALNTRRLHDYKCDTGAPSYEEAVVEVARLIYARHGNDRVKLDEIWDGA